MLQHLHSAWELIVLFGSNFFLFSMHAPGDNWIPQVFVELIPLIVYLLVCLECSGLHSVCSLNSNTFSEKICQLFHLFPVDKPNLLQLCNDYSRGTRNGRPQKPFYLPLKHTPTHMNSPSSLFSSMAERIILINLLLNKYHVSVGENLRRGNAKKKRSAVFTSVLRLVAVGFECDPQRWRAVTAAVSSIIHLHIPTDNARAPSGMNDWIGFLDVEEWNANIGSKF